jgi:hypothetical protein
MRILCQVFAYDGMRLQLQLHCRSNDGSLEAWVQRPIP